MGLPGANPTPVDYHVPSRSHHPQSYAQPRDQDLYEPETHDEPADNLDDVAPPPHDPQLFQQRSLLPPTQHHTVHTTYATQPPRPVQFPLPTPPRPVQFPRPTPPRPVQFPRPTPQLHTNINATAYEPVSYPRPQAFPPPTEQPQAFPPPMQADFQRPQVVQFQPPVQVSFQAPQEMGTQMGSHHMSMQPPPPRPQLFDSSTEGNPVANQNSMPPVGPERWKTGLFGCMDTPRNAILTAFCPCVTFGQIAEIIDDGRTACATSAIRYLCIAHWIGTPCLFSCHYRTKLRNRYGLNESIAQDCIIHCFCEWCALCQEYRELQHRGEDPSIGWNGNVANRQKMKQQQVSMMPPMHQTMRG